MKSVAVAAVVSLLVPATSLAAPRAAGRVPPADARAQRGREPLHVQVARAVFPRERWERQVSQASLDVTQKLAQGGEGQFRLDPDFADRLRQEYERLAPYEDLVATQARILHKQYTLTELKQLLAFYRSPLGHKSVLLVHDLTAYSNLQMQQKVHAGMSEALGRLTSLVHPVSPSADDAPAARPVPDLSANDAEAREL